MEIKFSFYPSEHLTFVNTSFSSWVTTSTDNKKRILKIHYSFSLD